MVEDFPPPGKEHKKNHFLFSFLSFFLSSQLNTPHPHPLPNPTQPTTPTHFYFHLTTPLYFAMGKKAAAADLSKKNCSCGRHATGEKEACRL